MKQDFRGHSRAHAKTAARNERVMDVATEYFAYVGVLGIAVCITVMALAFSAHVGVKVLNNVAKPGFFETESQNSAPAKAPDVQKFKFARFAMLPATTLHAQK